MYLSDLYDVAIVGSGPAGSAAAIELAQKGVKVALIDKTKLPRYKVCGGGVVQRAIKYLNMDMGDITENECRSVEINLAGSGLSFRSTYHEPVITMTMRDKLDYFLYRRAIDAGAKGIFPCEVFDVTENQDHVVLDTACGEICASFVIAADGAMGPVAKKIGWPESRNLIPALEYEVYANAATHARFADAARFDFDIINTGYGWVFPKKQHLSIGVLSMERGYKKLREVYYKYLNYLRIGNDIEMQGHGYVIPVGRRRDKFMRGRVMLCGDVAGFADPVTAEGISFAILSGQISAASILAGKFDQAVVSDHFHRELRKKIIAELQIGRLFSLLLYTGPAVRRILFRRFGDKLTNGMAKIFRGEKTYRQIVSNPVNYLRLIGSLALKS